jgi:hypothetical protein
MKLLSSLAILGTRKHSPDFDGAQTSVDSKRVLIALTSCLHNRQFHDLARSTWLKNQDVEYRFVLGRGNASPAKDEVVLDVSDGMRDLQDKVVAVIRWTLEQGYDHIFKADIDTFVHVPRLLTSGFENSDWSGSGYGGTGYFLNRKAMEAVLAGEKLDRGAEDLMIMKKLQNAGFVPTYDHERFNAKVSFGPAPDNSIVTVHQYSEKDARGAERFIGFRERIDRFPKHHEEAQKIPKTG